ncbi:hypothetical protein VNI00_001299 [Paramarasmius palmivorus]|uniref:Uncharacterized protein n=1 Tax=Paramarasmius palmivorus TaxID=297713 RepID=A0AAW0E5F9_9AGAR
MGGKINLYYKSYSKYVPVKHEECDEIDFGSVPLSTSDTEVDQRAKLVSVEEQRLMVQQGRCRLARGEKIDDETVQLIRMYDEDERRSQQAWESFCRWWEELQARREARRIEQLELEEGEVDGSDDGGDDGRETLSEKSEGSETLQSETAHNGSAHDVDCST